MNEAVLVVGKASAVLGLFSWLCGTVTTYVRGKTLESPNSEDGAVMNFFNKIFRVPVGKINPLPGNEEKDATVNRWLRIGNNNAANIPLTLIIFLLAATLNTLSIDTLNIIVWVFVAARICHTVFYALAIQPFRTILYSTACTCMFIAAGSLLIN